MDTPLDATATWLWFPESAEYKDGELRLVLAEGAVSRRTVDLEVLPGAVLKGLRPLEVPSTPRKFVVLFTDVILLHVLGEFAYRELPDEMREQGVVARHHNSALLKSISEFTRIGETTPGELLHFSVATSDDYYHVLTRAHPEVSQVEA